MNNTIEALKSDLRIGWPIAPGVIIPWNTQLTKAFAFGHPEIKNWKRWCDTNEGLKEIAYFSASWKVQIPSLPSLQSCQLEYHSNQVPLFKAIKCSFVNASTIKNELIENFGVTYESSPFLVDKLEVIEPDQISWAPFSEFPLRISFHPSDWVQFWIRPDLIR